MANKCADIFQITRSHQKMQMIPHYAHFQNNHIVNFLQYRNDTEEYNEILIIIKYIDPVYRSLIDMHALSWNKSSFLIFSHKPFLHENTRAPKKSV